MGVDALHQDHRREGEGREQGEGALAMGPGHQVRAVALEVERRPHGPCVQHTVDRENDRFRRRLSIREAGKGGVDGVAQAYRLFVHQASIWGREPRRGPLPVARRMASLRREDGGGSLVDEVESLVGCDFGGVNGPFH